MELPAALKEALKSAIARRTVAGNVADNAAELKTIIDRLTAMGFAVSTSGHGRHGQPALVALRPASAQGSITVALYNHYDVEPVHGKPWTSDPWSLSERNGRLYGRGIGDNKGVLYTRLHALDGMIQDGYCLPGLLWLIQGEEEVGPELAYEPFKAAIATYVPSLFLEETGYHRAGIPLLLMQGPGLSEQLVMAAVGKDRAIEQRTLNKSYQQKPCPFISSIPPNGTYVAFGPNDEHSRIHRSDESVSIELLVNYLGSFKSFLQASAHEP
jgi:acetylornithine deacetylase/succinyl-diaminopimelate desuccinylase-like protein